MESVISMEGTMAQEYNRGIMALALMFSAVIGITLISALIA